MRTNPALLVLAILLVPTALLVSAPPAAAATEYRVGDWVVAGIEQKFDAVVDLRGNLIIKSGGSLTFRNVTLLFNATSSLQYRVDVDSGGQLFLLEGSYIGSVNTLFKNSFIIRAGARATVISSTISEVGTSTTTGVRILSSDVVLQTSTVKNSSVGLDVVGAQPRLSSMTLTANTIGARFVNTTALLDKAVVTRSVIGVDVVNSTVSIEGPRLEQNNLAIRATSSNTITKSGTIRSNLDGIDVDRGTFALDGSTLTLSTLSGLRARNATVFVNYSSLNQNLDAAVIEDSALNSSYSSFWGNQRDFVLRGNTTIANISDSTLDTKLVDYSQGARLDRYWSLRTRVVSEKGLPVFNASVEVNHTATNFLWRNTTNAQGYSPFVLLFVMSSNGTNTTWVGPYNLSARHSGAFATAAINVTTTLTRVLVVRSPPAAPVLKMSEVKAFSGRASWTKYNGADFKRYDIHLSSNSWDPGPSVKNSTAVSLTTAIVDELVPNRDYHARVKLTVSDGRFSLSAPVEFRTEPEYPYPYNHTGPLNVCSLLVLRNGTWFVNGNVTVCPGGMLRLENATVVLNWTQPGASAVTIQSQGALSMEQSRISSKSAYRFQAKSGGAIDSIGSRFDRLLGGLQVDTDTASFSGTSFEDSDTALVVLRGTPFLKSVSFRNVTRGIVATDRDLVVEDSWFSDTGRAIDVVGGALVLRDATFNNCTVGVSARRAEVIATGLDFVDCDTGMLLQDSPQADVSQMQVLRSGIGLRAVNTTVTVTTSADQETGSAFLLENTTATIRQVTLQGGNEGITADRSTVTVQGLTASGTDVAARASDSELSVTDPRVQDSTSAFISERSNLTVEGGSVTQQNGPIFDLRDSNSTIAYMQVTGGSHSVLQQGGSVEIAGSQLRQARIGIESRGRLNASNTMVTGAVLYGVSLRSATVDFQKVFVSSQGLAGIRAEDSRIWMENSSVAPALRAITLQRSQLDLLGSNVPANLVDLDPLSVIRKSWHGFVWVGDHDGEPLAGVNVSVEDGENGSYSVSRVTGPSKLISWLRLLVEEINGTVTTQFNPFRFRAWNNQSSDDRTFNVTANGTVQLTLVAPPRPITLSPVRQADIFEDHIWLEWNSTGPGEIAWMHAQFREEWKTTWLTLKNLTEPVMNRFRVDRLNDSTYYDVRLAVYNGHQSVTYSEVRSFTTRPPNHAPQLDDAIIPAAASAGREFDVSVVYRDADGDPPKYVEFVAKGIVTNSTQKLAVSGPSGGGTVYAGRIKLPAGEYSAYFEADDNRSSPVSMNQTKRVSLKVTETPQGDDGLGTTALLAAGALLLLLVLLAVAIVRRRGRSRARPASSGRETVTAQAETESPGPASPEERAVSPSAPAPEEENRDVSPSGDTDASSGISEGLKEGTPEPKSPDSAVAAAAEVPPGHPLHPKVDSSDGPRRLAKKYRRLSGDGGPRSRPAVEDGGEGDGGAAPEQRA